MADSAPSGPPRKKQKLSRSERRQAKAEYRKENAKHRKEQRKERKKVRKAQAESASEQHKQDILISHEGINVNIKEGLRYIEPYYHAFQGFAKARWTGSNLLEFYTKEFLSYDRAYFEAAILDGRITVNDEKVNLNYQIRDQDRLTHTVHTHEPPVLGVSIQVLHRDSDRIVVLKPPSLPIHPCGRYRHNSVQYMLARQERIVPHIVHRLDRLTSGLLIFACTPEKAVEFGKELIEHQLQKNYLARVLGCFPEHEITVDEPLGFDRKLCVTSVTSRDNPQAKQAITLFQRLSYHEASNTSVVLAKPKTGRTHQIRAHLAHLNHPIANDFRYGGVKETVEDVLSRYVAGNFHPFNTSINTPLAPSTSSFTHYNSNPTSSSNNLTNPPPSNSASQSSFEIKQNELIESDESNGVLDKPSVDPNTTSPRAPHAHNIDSSSSNTNTNTLELSPQPEPNLPNQNLSHTHSSTVVRQTNNNNNDNNTHFSSTSSTISTIFTNLNDDKSNSNSNSSSNSSGGTHVEAPAPSAPVTSADPLRPSKPAWCVECAMDDKVAAGGVRVLPFSDRIPDEVDDKQALEIWLSAIRYSGPHWTFEVPRNLWPNWAEESPVWLSSSFNNAN